MIWKMQSPIGPLYLIANDVALTGLHFRPPVGELAKKLDSSPSAKIIKRTVDQLEEYFAGLRRDFDLPLAMVGTEFQQEVWGELSRIPYGKTFSYRDIAKKIKNDKAVRAVGTANGRNPIAIIVPCHRVIAADGTLGGYGGGLEIKTKLLEIERR